jgi:myo-inositol-1(or 4)-monophosphatase
MNKSPELIVAIEAANEAANVIKSFTDKTKSHSFELKGRHDLVTAADVASENEIKRIISKAFPDDLFMAEESHSGVGLTSDRTWIIDPIDGTTNFAHGVPFYAVSIALYINKKPQFAVILGVVQNELFTAEKGKGAYLNGIKISVSSVTNNTEALVGTGFPYRDLSVLDDYMKVFNVLMHETHGVRRPGSAAYDMAYVACGRYDGFYEYALAPWDVAAGTLIIREAGGIVTDWHGEDNWLLGKRIIAGNSSIHRYLKNVIQTNVDRGLWTTKS